MRTVSNSILSTLVRNQQYECAAKLAEKYLDFQSLVLICDETEDKDRLDEYTRKYEEYDFSQYAINWHLRQNRHAEVFERFKGNQTALAQFMRDHPSLGWIQLMFNGDFERAAKVLFDLAQCETEFVARKKSMLSLAKLAALAVASDMSAHVEKINQELTVIEYQSHLGHDVLQNFGFDATDQRVLKPEEIINVCIMPKLVLETYNDDLPYLTYSSILRRRMMLPPKSNSVSPWVCLTMSHSPTM